MKAEIKDGKLTITPESYSEEYVLACFKVENEMNSGRTDNVSFEKHPNKNLLEQCFDTDLMAKMAKECEDKVDAFMSCKKGFVETEGEEPDQPLTMDDDWNREFKKSRERGGGIDPSIRRCKEGELQNLGPNNYTKADIGDELKMPVRNDSPTKMKCENEGECSTCGKPKDTSKARKFILRKSEEEASETIRIANLERDEILKNAHEAAEDIMVGARWRADSISEEANRKRSECTDSCLFYLAECGTECNDMIKEAKSEAEDRIAEGVALAVNIVKNAKEDADKIKTSPHKNGYVQFKEVGCIGGKVIELRTYTDGTSTVGFHKG